MMLRRRDNWGLLLIVVWGLASGFSSANAADEKPVIQWRFNQDKDSCGWTASGQIADFAVKDGAMHGRPTGSDPILLGPVFEIAATPTQRLEIKMKATKAGLAQLFWAETLEGPYGGFGQEKCESFAIAAGAESRVYRLMPFWHAAKKIVRLRFDPPSEGEFAVEWIRIIDDPSPMSSATRWDRQTGWEGWRAWQDMSAVDVRQGFLRSAVQGASPILVSPSLNVPAAENPYVCLRMAAKAGSTAQVFRVVSNRCGAEKTAIPLRADGKVHNYVVKLGSERDDSGQILLLGVQPTDADGAEVAIQSIALASQPVGPAEFDVTYFGKAEGVNRAGRPAKVVCSVRNVGGNSAKDVTATLSVPQGVKIVGPAMQKIDLLTRFAPRQVEWQIESATAGNVDLTVKLDARDVEPATASAQVPFAPPLELTKAAYVPEPRPVKSKYDVGVYYFPGWYDISRWRPIFDYPDRKPILGWYDEANPECADWQIKWAVEHGVSFFMVDWYWCQGNRSLEHWLHDAYGKAKYRKYLKWAIMWANHNPPNTHSADDWRKVTQYWIDHYFGMEEYYRIDGRPVVFIWSPDGIRRDVGGSEEAAKLYAMSQQMARDAGHKGIYFVAMFNHNSAAECQQLKSEGYEGITSYHGFEQVIHRAGKPRVPYADVVDFGPELWKMEDQRASGLTYMPVVDTGWSSEPWHHEKAMALTGRTPELFGKLCRQAREYADKTGRRIIALGPWNEWGEGSYIEPFTERGFEYLDQIREAFCEPGDYPPNLVPADVGLGPYDFPIEPPQSAWRFDTEGKLEGWSANSALSKPEVQDSFLAAESVDHDPILQVSELQIEAETIRYLKIRMRSDAADKGQLFWATADSPISEANSVQFDIHGDGQFHDYVIELGQSPRWQGLVTALRFDPATKPGVKFAIDRIEFSAGL